MKSKINPFRSTPIAKKVSLFSLGFALTCNFAMAADIRYAGDGDWSTAANWQGGVKPSNGDAARGNWGGNTVTVTTTESVGAVQWGVDEASTLRIQTGGNLTVVGAQWSGLGAGGTTTGTLFVEGGQLTINNSDFYMGLGGNPYTVSANISSGLMDVNGVFRQDNGSVASGTTTLSGTGVLEVNQFLLSGANNTLTFDGGTLRAGASSATWLTGNGTARINSTGATIDTGAFDVTASSALTQNGASTGGGLTKSGAGTLTLTGANTYTGDTIINGGKLQLSGSGNLAGGNYAGAITLSNSATFENAGGGTLALSGAITGSGTVSMNGGGQLLIQNGGNSYSALNIADSRVFIMSTGALPAAATVGLTGGTLDFDTGGTYNSAITVSSGANIAARAATNLTNVTLPSTGTVIFNNDDAPTATLEISSDQTLTDTLTVQLGGSRMGPAGGALGVATLSGNITGSGPLVVASSGNINNPNFGTGVLNLTNAANDYTGDTTLTRGTLRLSGGGRLNNGNYAGAITLGDSTHLEKLSGSTQFLTGIITGTGTVTNANGELIITNAGNDFAALNIISGRVFIAGDSAALPSAATVNLTGGTLDFDVAGTYDSAITVASGANIAARGAAILNSITLPGTGTVIFNNDDAPTAILEISSNQTLTDTLTVQLGGARMGETGGALGVTTLSGVITGSGSLVMTSSGNISNPNFSTGVLALSGANDYTGDTTVNSGTLAVNGTALPDGTKLTLDGGRVDLTGAETVNTLFFGAVQQAAGTYSSDGAGGTIPSANFTGAGTLIVTNGSAAGYSSWASINGAGANLNDDHDSDGVANGIEFFIGGSTLPAANTTGFTAVPSVTTTAGVRSVTWTKAATYTGTYGTDFWVQTSATLNGDWVNEPNPGGNVTIIGNDVKFTFPAGTKNFARLKVTGP